MPRAAPCMFARPVQQLQPHELLMAHFSLVCPDDAGHLLPIGAVGGELQRRGHRVTVIARAKAAPLAAQLGLAFCELKTEGVPSPSSYLLWRVFRAFGAAWMIGMRSPSSGTPS